MHKRKCRTLDTYEIEYYKKHPKELKTYIDVALEEYQKDGHEKAFLSALAIAAKVCGGYSHVSRASGLNRENLYRVFSEKSDPRLSTVVKLMHSLGLSLKVA
jgi:probable addiction module antidote protein